MVQELLLQNAGPGMFNCDRAPAGGDCHRTDDGPPRAAPTNRKNDVITICSHCKRVISQTLHRSGCDNGDGEELISHGICTTCLAILENRIRERPDLSLAPPRARERCPLKVKDHG